MMLKFRNDEKIGLRDKLIVLGPEVVLVIAIILFIHRYLYILLINIQWMAYVD